MGVWVCLDLDNWWVMSAYFLGIINGHYIIIGGGHWYFWCLAL
ncbi:hypothetical protein [Moraxella lacunata]